MNIMLMLMFAMLIPGTIMYCLINGDMKFLQDVKKLKEWSSYTVFIVLIVQVALNLIISGELVDFENKTDIIVLFMLSVIIMAIIVGVFVRIVMNSTRKTRFWYDCNQKKMEIGREMYELSTVEKSIVFEGKKISVCYCKEETIKMIDTQADVVIVEDQNISEDKMRYIIEHIRPRYILGNRSENLDEWKKVLAKTTTVIEDDFEHPIEILL